jgi:hypothetical protein
MATAPVPSEARVGALPTGTTWSIRSMRGALGALALLLALPITIAAQIVAPDSGQVVIHIVLCIGALLIALSVFDFATPHGLAWAACGAGLAIGAIFFTQALAPITQNETLMSLSYGREVSGWGETITITILMLWFMVLATTLGRGVTTWLGVLSAALVIGLLFWVMLVGPPEGTPEALRLLLLLPFAWYLFVSTRRSRAREQGLGR